MSLKNCHPQNTSAAFIGLYDGGTLVPEPLHFIAFMAFMAGAGAAAAVMAFMAFRAFMGAMFVQEIQLKAAQTLELELESDKRK